MEEISIGQEFGKLTVVEKIGGLSTNGRSINTKYRCKCQCGREKILFKCHLLRDSKRRSRSCGQCLPRGQYSSKNSPIYKGYEDITGRFWRIINNGAKVRNLEFTVTLEYIWDLWLQQNQRCALTNIPLVLAKTHKEQQAGVATASLDRIDSSKGYVPGNVQWIHKDLQPMKNDMDEKYFKTLCYLVVEKDRCQIANIK